MGKVQGIKGKVWRRDREGETCLRTLSNKTGVRTRCATHFSFIFSVFSFPLQDHLSIYSHEIYKETLIDSKHISISEMLPWATNSVFGTLFLKVYTEEPR